MVEENDVVKDVGGSFLAEHLEVRVQRAPIAYGDAIDVMFCARCDGKRYLAEPLTMKEMPTHTFVAGPTLSLSYAKAQLLMDSLWDAGLRPSEGTGSAGAMAAVQKHLEDMRRIAFAEPPEPQLRQVSPD